jgi:hypothetical protein
MCNEMKTRLDAQFKGREAKRGTRPNAPRDQRTASAYIFGAIWPKVGKGAALVLPRCDTEAMNLHPGRNRHPDRAGPARHAARRSGRLASFRPPDRSA